MKSRQNGRMKVLPYPLKHPSGAFQMKKPIHALVLLAVGVVAGVCLSSLWPNERAFAAATDRDSRFAMATCQVSDISGVEGVFVLDFLTGQLRGGVLNTKTGKFQYTYVRNVAADFNIDPSAEPHFAIVSGRASLPNAGRIQPAQGVVYIAELSSGRVAAYMFPYQQGNNSGAGIQMTPLDSFQFREASN